MGTRRRSSSEGDSRCREDSSEAGEGHEGLRITSGEGGSLVKKIRVLGFVRLSDLVRVWLSWIQAMYDFD